MLPFAEKRSTFSSGVRGPTDLCSGPPHAHDLQHARKISVEHNDELRRYRGLYTLGAVGIGNSREWLTLRRAVNSNCATSLEENTSKASLQDATINKKISSWGMWNQDYLPEVPVCMDLGHPYYYLTCLLVGLTPT